MKNFKQFLESNDVDEALDMKQRRQRAIAIRKNKARLAMGRRKAANKIAGKEKLMKRARRQARNALTAKIVKDIPKADLTPARKKEIEKRLEKPAMQRKIGMMARKMLKDVRKKEIARKRG